MIVLAIYTLNFFHPGRLLPKTEAPRVDVENLHSRDQSISTLNGEIKPEMKTAY